MATNGTPYGIEDIRNIALVGHVGCGKTTLFEALLHAGGTINQCGTVERGSTVSDYDPLEKSRQHSINTTLAPIDHGGVHINLIDTPGYADFLGPTLSAICAVETCGVVVNAAAGIEPSAVRLMEHAKARGVARWLIVNKIDQEDISLSALIEQLRATFGAECLPVNLPADDASRVVDCFFQSEGDSDIGSVAEAHQQILDQVVETDETVMARYLEDGESSLTRDELHEVFERALREQHLVPICFVSARTMAGVPELLTLLEQLAPNPCESNPPPFIKGADANAVPITAVPDPDAHVIADVFKLINDPFVGKLSIFRIYQGTVRKDSQLLIDDGRRSFKVGHLFQMRGKDHIEIPAAIAGDIAAVAKIDDIHFDAILHDSHDEDQIHLKPIDFPEPMFGLAVESARTGQEQRLSLALTRLAEEDPCFRYEHNKELNETVIRGLSELHLKVMIERMQERFGVEVTTRPPRIAYRETITEAADGHSRHKKQTGGAGQFGEVFLRVEPLPRGGGFEFVDAVVGGAIPNQFIPAVEKGVRQVIDSGAVAGYPMQDIRVTVYDGKHHPVDSKEIAFISAGRKAFLDAIGKARPVVLEPVVDLEVMIPEENMGAITSGLATKRARIQATDAYREGGLVIRAQVPLAEIRDYSNELTAHTTGRGRYAMQFSHYEVAPAEVQKALLAAYRPSAEDG
jgi:elongation factor G